MHVSKTDNIDLNDIDWKNNSFHISSPDLCSTLINSIATIGIINQPFVILKNDKYVIVSGFRRLQACQRLNTNYILAKILDPQISDCQCAKIAISDNSLQRPLNLMEQSRSYTLLEAVCEDKKVFQEILISTGLSNNSSWINKVKSLCRLPSVIQYAIEKEAIPLVIAQMLSEIEEELAIFLTHLFQDLTLGLNKQREIIQMASEIAKHNDLSLKDFFYSKELQDIIEDPLLDKNKKTFKIRQWLKEKRYPQLSKEQKRFNEKLKLLKLGNNVKLIPPAYFEGNNFSLSLTFSTKEELIRLRENIQRIENDEYLTSILQ
jgi:ParB family chromosome partitioning protein